MKIDKLDSLLNLAMPEKRGGAPKAGGSDFRKIFEEVQANQAGEKKKIADSGSAGKTAGISDGPLGLCSFPLLTESGDPFQTRARSMQTADRMLGALEDYQRGLGDAEVSLKSLYPAIQSLSAEIRGMKQDSEGLPANDSLKRILDEIGILAAVEVERFNRGDYVS
jgi:hypothetical protein